MSYTEDQLDTIKKYAAHQYLNDDETQFVQYNKETEAFQKELIYQKALIDSVTNKERAFWKEKFETIDANYPQINEAKERKLKFKKNIILIFAGIVILVMFFYLIMGVNQAKDNEILFAQYYEPFPNLITPLNRDINDTNIDGFQEYELGNYKEALIKLETSNDSNSIIQLYKALCLLQLDETEKSINILSKVAANEKAKYHDAAEWYLILTMIKNKQLVEAKGELLKLVDDQDHLYWNKGTKLLKKINSSRK